MDNNGFPFAEEFEISYYTALNTNCVEDWKSDGNCDSVNNNENCEYDGGDCC
jgi:hypothetical protein